MTETCDLSVVIVTWNSSAFIGRCLDALRAGTGRAFECLVVDNNSGDSTVAIVQGGYPWVQLLTPGRNLGFAAANNLALRQATGAYLLLLNPDTEVRPGAIDKLVDFLEARPDAGAVGPRLLNDDGSTQFSTFLLPRAATIAWEYFLRDLARPNDRRAGRYDVMDYARDRQVEGLLGACFLARRSAASDIGFLDERFWLYCEEVDWCIRLRRAGWQVWYTPAAEVVHSSGQSARLASESSFTALQRSRFKLYSKWYPRRQRVLLETITRAGLLYQAVFWLKQTLRGHLPASECRGRLALTARLLTLRPSGLP